MVKMDSYYKEFQHIDPLQAYKPWMKTETNPNDMLMPANERQIAAVFVCSDPVDWGRDLQVRGRFHKSSRLSFDSMRLFWVSILLLNFSAVVRTLLTKRSFEYLMKSLVCDTSQVKTQQQDVF